MMNTLRQRVRVGFALIAASLFVLTLTAYGREAAKGPKAAAAEHISPEMREALERKVDLQFEDMPISDVVAFLQEIVGISIVLFPQDLPSDESDWTVGDWEVPAPFGNASAIFESTVTLKHKGTLAEILDEVCEMLGLAWSAEGNAIRIASARRLALQLDAQVGPTPPEMREALSTEVSVSFDRTPFNEVFPFLQEMTGLRLRVLKSGLKRGGWPLVWVDEGPWGRTTTEVMEVEEGWGEDAPRLIVYPTVTLVFEGTLQQTLNLTCQLTEVSWMARDGVVFVGHGPEMDLAPGWRKRRGQPDIVSAAASGKVDLVRAFLKDEPELLNRRSPEGFTPLLAAAGRGRREMVRFLLAEGARVEAENYQGETPLHAAARLRRLDIVELLTTHGADVNAARTHGTTPLEYAMFDAVDIPVMELLLSHGASVDTKNRALRSAAGLQNVGPGQDEHELVRLLLTSGAEANGKDRSGRTALHEAASMGHNETIKVLLAHGADVNAAGTLGYTPLHEAIGPYSPIETVELLLLEGAVANAKNDRGQTPLHIAALWGVQGAAALLMQHGADVNARDANGDTALHLAARFNKSAPVVELLLANGADVAAKDNRGRTPSDMAREGGADAFKVLKILREHEAAAARKLPEGKKSTRSSK